MKTRFFTMVILLMASALLISNPAQAGKKKAMYASSLENAMDPQMSVESWMTTELYWHPDMLSEMVSYSEGLLILEEWMVNSSLWEQLEKAQDCPLTIQAWMTQPVMWEKQGVESEGNLSLETWMTDTDHWRSTCPVAISENEEALKLESWMVCNDLWRS